MNLDKNLEEKVVCKLDSKTKLPGHTMKIPEENQIKGVSNFYCCDFRRNECSYSFEFENRTYCKYKA